jgi:hypothetical protein
MHNPMAYQFNLINLPQNYFQAAIMVLYLRAFLADTLNYAMTGNPFSGHIKEFIF